MKNPNTETKLPPLPPYCLFCDNRGSCTMCRDATPEEMIKDFLGRPVKFKGLFDTLPVTEILRLGAVESICMFLSQDYWKDGDK